MICGALWVRIINACKVKENMTLIHSSVYAEHSWSEDAKVVIVKNIKERIY